MDGFLPLLSTLATSDGSKQGVRVARHKRPHDHDTRVHTTTPTPTREVASVGYSAV